MCHFLHGATTPVWMSVGVALTPPVSSEGELAIGVAGEVSRVLVRAVVDRFGVEDVEMMLSELGGSLLLAPLLEVLPSLTQYRTPFWRTQPEGLSLLYDREGFNFVKSSTFTADVFVSYVLFVVIRVN